MGRRPSAEHFCRWEGLSWTKPSSRRTFCGERRGVSWGWVFPFIFEDQDGKSSVLGWSKSKACDKGESGSKANAAGHAHPTSLSQPHHSLARTEQGCDLALCPHRDLGRHRGPDAGDSTGMSKILSAGFPSFIYFPLLWP